MYFASPQYLSLLLIILLLALLAWGGYKLRSKQLRRFAAVVQLKQLAPEVSNWRRLVRNSLLLAALASIILMLARPQIETATQKQDTPKGVEVMVAMDISNSMLAEDISPNRLQFTQRTLLRLLDLQRNSKFGLVYFAGNAYMQLPLTTDLAMAQTLIQEASTDMLSNQGTDIEAALNLAASSFSSQREMGRAILLFTDGETHEGEALKAAQKVSEKGIKVYTIAVGSEKGAPIPWQGSFLTDADNKMVITRSNPTLCNEIAQAGGGELFISKKPNTLATQLDEALRKLPQAAMQTSTQSKKELFGWFALIAIVLLLLMECIMPRRNRIFAKLNLFDRL